jgi:hypothetical protein
MMGEKSLGKANGDQYCSHDPHTTRNDSSENPRSVSSFNMESINGNPKRAPKVQTESNPKRKRNRGEKKGMFLKKERSLEVCFMALKKRVVEDMALERDRAPCG